MAVGLPIKLGTPYSTCTLVYIQSLVNQAKHVAGRAGASFGSRFG